MTSPSPCIVLCSRARVKCSACAVRCRVRSSNSACGLPEVFHVSPRYRSRSIARVDLCRWCDHASDRSQVFRLQANDAISRHLLEVLPWLNFTPDTQQVQAERFSLTLEQVSVTFRQLPNLPVFCGGRGGGSEQNMGMPVFW